MMILEPGKLSDSPGRLIDVRNFSEFAGERLARAECVPLDRLLSTASEWDPSEPVILMCKSGVRSSQGARQLEEMGFGNVSTLEGGIEACRKAGLDVVKGKKRRSIFQQVLILSGTLLLVSLALAPWSPWFLLATAFIAGGLVFAGATGICPMATILEKMPWNAQEGCVSQGCTQESK